MTSPDELLNSIGSAMRTLGSEAEMAVAVAWFGTSMTASATTPVDKARFCPLRSWWRAKAALDTAVTVRLLSSVSSMPSEVAIDFLSFCFTLDVTSAIEMPLSVSITRSSSRENGAGVGMRVGTGVGLGVG